ncbi:phosphotransferase family protein [Merismopedia glauca]|uniref:LPS biosynthesis choline kinase n=1 Tax=Merismopedia glauca CCAP 1448/3 TaxID=1296344 RepID=A0A2T1C1Q6_9CYAN|nr:phosphotransferase [Merismopedia glauca]PSB02210.1 LPS biosynthesis choline kinase [Merismopedia glauca CCAP 1448/3]
MSFLLSSQNVFTYLNEKNLCGLDNYDRTKVELKIAKNFNLLVTLESSQKLLVKQERHNKQGKSAGEFLREWRIQELLHNFAEFAAIRHLFPEVLDFDRDKSIITFNYLDNYRDLAEFYTKEQTYPEAIATDIGAAIAKIHRFTLNKLEYRDFLTSESPSELQIALYLGEIDRITPEVFGIYPADGLKFLALYQRYDSLGKAIASLTSSYQPCCLTHNDLKFNNLLLNNDWAKNISDSPSILRLIDWERSSWGDPAFDIGSLVASYVQIWLGSLVVSKDITLEESLRMAVTPLELLQPSLAAMITTYLAKFPEILQQQPAFISRVVQFAGLVLIQQIQAMLQYQKVFNNIGICMLQVAKSFLCRPQASIPTIFGLSESELTNKSKPEPILI